MTTTTQDQTMNAVNQLQALGIRFETQAGGMHLLVQGMDERGQPETIDFWPSTEHWKVRGKGVRMRGVSALIERVKP